MTKWTAKKIFNVSDFIGLTREQHGKARDAGFHPYDLHERDEHWFSQNKEVLMRSADYAPSKRQLDYIREHCEMDKPVRTGWQARAIIRGVAKSIGDDEKYLDFIADEEVAEAERVAALHERDLAELMKSEIHSIAHEDRPESYYEGHKRKFTPKPAAEYRMGE